jgi:hypothetical protein
MERKSCLKVERPSQSFILLNGNPMKLECYPSQILRSLEKKNSKKKDLSQKNSLNLEVAEVDLQTAHSNR